MEFKHKSVLLEETIDNLNIKPDGIYVDGTLGGAGHSYQIAKRLTGGGRLIGIDQDADAIAAATERLKEFEERVTLVRNNYCNMDKVLEDLGISSSGLDKLIAASYRILGLISYLTAGETETRAWTITKGTKAPQAAGKIHSDFERGFIKAEVVYYQDLLDCGSYNGAKEKGLVRMEGKEYVVKDGDVILFRFNV